MSDSHRITGNHKRGLPSSGQTWSHATNSIAKLKAALADPLITAIEADICMGRDSNKMDGTDARTPTTLVPIMSHPPELESDLSVATFLDLVTETYHPYPKERPHVVTSSESPRRALRKHIKLDFKVMEAVEPTLQALADLRVHLKGLSVFLNADIIPGPGKAATDVEIPADQFIETCLAMVSKDADYAFSLGFKVEVVHPFGHTVAHLQEMAKVVRRHDLMKQSAGVVLAINARLLFKNLAPFDKFLQEFPSSQILAWTGATEPPISRHKVNRIKKHFDACEALDSVGFDCNVAPSFLTGFAYDLAIDIYGMLIASYGLLVYPFFPKSKIE